MTESPGFRLLMAAISVAEPTIRSVTDAVLDYLHSFEEYDDVYQELLQEPLQTLESMETFVAKNTIFAERLEKISIEALKDIKPGLRHHSIHIISRTLDVPSVIGMT